MAAPGKDFNRRLSLLTVVLLLAFLFLCTSSSEGSRTLRHLQGEESQQGASAAVLEGFRKYQRLNTMESDAVRAAQQDSHECNVDQLQECAPPAQGSYGQGFPTFESKREVPNGPNPLHN